MNQCPSRCALFLNPAAIWINGKSSRLYLDICASDLGLRFLHSACSFHIVTISAALSKKIYSFEAMNTQTLSTVSLDYDPNRLLDTVLARLGVNSDKALSRKLQVADSVISKIRSRRLPVAASLLLWMSECTGASIQELRQILGDRRAKARMVYVKNSRPVPRP